MTSGPPSASAASADLIEVADPDEVKPSCRAFRDCAFQCRLRRDDVYQQLQSTSSSAAVSAVDGMPNWQSSVDTDRHRAMGTELGHSRVEIVTQRQDTAAVAVVGAGPSVGRCRIRTAVAAAVVVLHYYSTKQCYRCYHLVVRSECP